jgi:hypothetical protein
VIATAVDDAAHRLLAGLEDRANIIRGGDQSTSAMQDQVRRKGRLNGLAPCQRYAWVERGGRISTLSE